MNDEKACSLVNDDSIRIDNQYFMYSGALVTDGVSFTLVDKNDGECTHLPVFIKSDVDADYYISSLQRHYVAGTIDGKESFKREVVNLFKLK